MGTGTGLDAGGGVGVGRRSDIGGRVGSVAGRGLDTGGGVGLGWAMGGRVGSSGATLVGRVGKRVQKIANLGNVGRLVVVAGNVFAMRCGDGTDGTRGDAATGDGRLGNARGEDRIVGEEALSFEPGLSVGYRETLGRELLLLDVLAVMFDDGKDELRPEAVGLGAWVMLDGP
jgi:hypothetical protein